MKRSTIVTIYVLENATKKFNLMIFSIFYNFLIIFYFFVQETTFEDKRDEGSDIKAVIFGDDINEEDARPDQELSGKEKIEDTEKQPKKVSKTTIT